MARQQIATGREFRGHVDAYWEACEQRADAQLEPTPAAPAEETEKKGSKRKPIRTNKASISKPARSTRSAFVAAIIFLGNELSSQATGSLGSLCGHPRQKLPFQPFGFASQSAPLLVAEPNAPSAELLA